MRILGIEPYYGGSHRSFLDGLVRHIPGDWTTLTLPARGWKWRLRTAAPHLARELGKCSNSTFDVIFASSMLALSDFQNNSGLRDTPSVLYFHENQFAYPVRHDDSRDLHLALTTVLSAAAADVVVFNSLFNQSSFMQGARDLLQRSPDTDLHWMLESIEANSRILPVPIDLMDVGPTDCPRPDEGAPVICWNHRWEHDKNPEEFFKVLFQLAEEDIPFRVALLGQPFEGTRALFNSAVERLGSSRVIQFGPILDRREYLSFLGSCSIVVSTAHHEFQGLSILEAAARGAHPVLPNRLSYPELFDAECLYDSQEGFLKRLRSLLKQCPRPNKRVCDRAAGYQWSARIDSFEDLLHGARNKCR